MSRFRLKAGAIEGESRRPITNRPQAASPMSLSFLESGRQSRAALLSRAGRPRPACSVCNTLAKADEDVGCGPGGRPTVFCNLMTFGEY